MSITKTLYGTTRIIPQTDETGWGAEVTGSLEDIHDALEDTTLQLTGGTIVKKVTNTASSLADNATLTPVSELHTVTGSGGAVTLNATTSITDGTAGQILLIIGGSDANTVTILNGSNTKMNGPITLSQYDRIDFYFDGTYWVEVGRST